MLRVNLAEDMMTEPIIDVLKRDYNRLINEADRLIESAPPSPTKNAGEIISYRRQWQHVLGRAEALQREANAIYKQIEKIKQTLKGGTLLIIEIGEYSDKATAGLYEVCRDFCIDEWNEREMTTGELLEKLESEGIIKHIPTAELWINDHLRPRPISDFEWKVDQ